MSETKQQSVASSEVSVDEHDASLLDYALIVRRHLRLIGGLCLAALAGTLMVSVLSQKIYESTATVLAPKEGGAGSVLGGLATSGLLQQLPLLSVPSLT